jgi:GNAT superfamily N-acetyltransferase
MKVREADETDAGSIAELMSTLGYATSRDEARRRLERLRSLPGSAVLVAELDGRVAGVIALSAIHLLERGQPSCRITALVVRPELRRQGIATSLLTEADQEARRQGCFRLEVTSRPERPAAHAFYEQAGFSERPHRFVRAID